MPFPDGVPYISDWFQVVSPERLKRMAVKKLHTALVVLALGLALAAAYWLQNRPRNPTAAAAAAAGTSRPASGPGRDGDREGPATVEVGRVEAADLKDETQAVGTLRSRQGVMLRPEVSGRVQKLGFRDGQAVRRGQLLVQLDDALQAAQAQQAHAQAGIARTSLQRNRELLAQNFVSQSVVDQALANLQVAEAQVALAQAQVARMRIVAPFDGLVGIRLVNVGDYVKDGADLINLEDVSTMWVDFRLPERVINRIKPGQAVSVALESLPQRTFTGQVDALDSQIEANGRSVLVRAKLQNAQGLLKPGMFARTGIVFSRRAGALVVPEEALVPQGSRQFIIKVADAGKGPVSQRLEVRLGLRVPGKVEVLAPHPGLALGDLVATAGQARLMRADGLPVKVVDVSRGGAATASAPPAAASSASDAGAASAARP
jgi:membrane fusion protein, multidrug efflux system